MRHLSSSGVDPYTALSGAAGAFFGERKSTDVIQMLKNIKSVENVNEYVSSAKIDQTLLCGFSNKSIDPRAILAKNLARELLDVIGSDPLCETAFALEETISNDSYFADAGKFCNVDYWLAIIVHSLDFPTGINVLIADMFPVLAFIPRIPGMIAHFIEGLDSPDFKIFRPRQVFNGHVYRDFEHVSSPRQTASVSAPNFALKDDSKAVAQRTSHFMAKVVDSFRKPGSATCNDLLDDIKVLTDALNDMSAIITETPLNSKQEKKLLKRIPSVSELPGPKILQWLNTRLSKSNLGLNSTASTDVRNFC